MWSARAAGLDSAFSWESPERFVSANAMFTWQDVRVTSQRGPYSSFEGARIPSRPWLFASWGSRLRLKKVLLEKDRIEPFYSGRYVHPFDRSWSDYGIPGFKIRMPAQFTHSAGITWLFSHAIAHFTLTVEVDNLTDANLYDQFGAQRPGRAFYAKVTADLR